MLEWFAKFSAKFGADVDDDKATQELADSWEASADEKRRVFIFHRLANSDIDGCIAAKNMAIIENWLKTGVVTAADVTPGKTSTLLTLAGGNK